MVKLPAGTTTISGHSWQSRKTVPGARPGAFACAAACMQAPKLPASARMTRSFIISVRHVQIAGSFEARVSEKHALCGRHSRGRTRTALEEFPPGEIFCH